MPEIQKANNQGDAPSKTNEYSLKPAVSAYKALPIGLRRIVNVVIFLFAVIVGIAFFHPSLAERWKFGTDMTLNLLIGLAVAIQVYISVGHWDVMKQTLKHSERVFDLIERPIVVAESADIPNLAVGVPLVPQVVFANKGRTAAQNFKVGIDIAGRAARMWVVPRRDIAPRGDWFLGEDDRVTIKGNPQSAVTLGEPFYGGAIGGQNSLIIHGKGSYDDLAGREYPIEFAFVYDRSDGFVRYPMWK